MRLKEERCNRFHYPAGNWQILWIFLFMLGMLGLGIRQANASILTWTDPNKIVVTFSEGKTVNAVEIQCEPNDVNTNFSVSYGTPNIWKVGPIVTHEASPGVIKSYIRFERSSGTASDTFTTRIKSPSDVNTRDTRGRFCTFASSDGSMVSDNSGQTYLKRRRTDVPALFKLDFNNTTDNNDTNSQPGFTRFTEENSGDEDVNGQAGVVVELSGDIASLYRSDPNNKNDPCDPTFDPNRQPIYFTKLYRDFICGNKTSTNGVTITLWGLGAGQDCNVILYSFDSESTLIRRADWRANGKYLFTTDFIGNDPCNWPRTEDAYAWPGTAKADDLGRITLTSSRDPCSPASESFAFVNGLMVYTTGTYVEPKYAQVPRPANGKQNVPSETLLKWRKGAGVAKHDLYFGANFNDVNTATRDSHPGVLIYAPDLDADANTYDLWSAVGLLSLYQTYYWRVDENDTSNIWKGEVWSFDTPPYFVVEDFNSYENDSALQSVWTDGSTNSTSAEVSVETAIVRGGNSMKYRYKNNLSPYYSEVRADVNTAQPNGLGEDPDWLGIGAKTLVLWFYGQAGNDANQPMYVTLTDGDTSPHTAQVNYNGDMNNVKEETWHEWHIDLQDFVDNNNVNLANVAKITIGFGNGTQAASDGIVYFEDIQLYKKHICPIDIIASDLNGDCAVDYRDLRIIANNWLRTDCTAPDNCGGADFGPDGKVDLSDFSNFAMQWLWGPPSCDEGFTVPPMPSFSSLPINPYLPDPFRFMNGARMTAKDQWTCRRAEIAALVQEFELGYKQYTPYSATTGWMSGNSIVVDVCDTNHISFSCSITYPATGSPPYPAMIGCGISSLDNTALSNLGVALIIFPSDTIAQENDSTSRGKGLFYNMYGSGHSAGALMAWAWGMDRLIDAIEKTPACNIDPTRLGVTGCSRWGKGALICGAFDERIKLAIPEESGSGGCASWRVSDWQGTSVQTLCELVGENVWMRANFNQFCNNTNKLPFDHHEIAGLCAPRALLFIENSSMVWLGNVSTWTTGNVAHKIWEALGIPDMMGYSSVGGHDHCAFPSSQQPEVTAYVQKFLVGGGTGNTNVMKCDGGVTYNESQWVNWTVPPLQ